MSKKETITISIDEYLKLKEENVESRNSLYEIIIKEKELKEGI
jgi:hypothetical protein